MGQTGICGMGHTALVVNEWALYVMLVEHCFLKPLLSDLHNEYVLICTTGKMVRKGCCRAVLLKDCPENEINMISYCGKKPIVA